MLIPILFYQTISVLVKIRILTLLKCMQVFAGKESIAERKKPRAVTAGGNQ